MLFNKIISVIHTKTINHFFITSGGTIVNGTLGLLFYIYIARLLGPADFGILSIAIAAITLIADIGDLGIDTGIIRFVGKYNMVDKDKALKFLKLGLKVKLFIWLICFVLGWFLMPAASELIFLKSDLTLPLRLSLIGAGGAMLFSLSTHAIQSYQKFWIWNFLNIGTNGLRLLAIIALSLFSILNLPQVLITYITLPFLGFFISLIFLPNYLTAKNERSVASELLNYSKWVAVVGLLTATAFRLDTFLSARFLTVAQVGIYSVAAQVTTVAPQLIFALATVVAPKLSSFDTRDKVIAYLKKLQLLTLGMSLVGFLLLPIGIFLLPQIYGADYEASIPPFIILFIAQIVFLLALPAQQAIFYYFAKPKFFNVIALGQLSIMGVGGWFLISSFGVLGAAITVLLSNIFSFLISSIWVLYQFKTGKK